MKKFAVLSVVVVFLALAFPLNALAAGPSDTKVILGSSYTLESGDLLDGDLLVLGGSASLESNSLVDGNVFVLGGNVEIAGVVEGSVGVLGGNVLLMGTSVVTGDVVSLGGTISRRTGAVIEGELSPNFGFDIDAPVPTLPRGITLPDFSRLVTVSPWISIFWFLFRVLVLAGLAALVVMFWPEATGRTGEAAIGYPLPAGGLGLLTIIAGPIMLVILLITILLSPVSLVGFVILAAAAVFGWIAIGFEVGKRIGQGMKWELQAPAAAGLGTLLLSLVAGGIDFIPCVGWLAPFLVISLGLGAVILTRFGSQQYLGSAASASLAAPQEVPPAPPAPAPKKRTTKKTEDK
ncbi:MAG TPA: polymer-forming cytoskeletal protein [Anaerolineae bacterium]|nr:polymer-forming cytoskeletal protein [Anaerolineae bacterium]